jgi:uncharacterized protein involved in response to NO
MQRSLRQDRGVARRPVGDPLFSYGFRPFFLGAALWAILSVALWLGSLAGLWQLAPGYGALAWHAHEMLFGYGSAVVAGFLLTAVPNWTGSLPVAGWRLMLLFALWCLARAAFLVMGPVGPLPGVVIDSLFLPCLLLVMAREIVAGRNWRNLKPLALVGLLAAADVAFNAEVLIAGAPDISIRVGVVALIGLIMLIGGRIVPSFTHSWLSRMRSSRLPAPFGRTDKVALIISGAALLLWIARPASVETGLLFLAATAAQAIRLFRWRGMDTWGEPLVLVLHLGYAFIPVGFLLGAISILLPGSIAGTAPLHAWTVGAVGLMTLGVMTRATRGHTGRDLTAPSSTISIYGAMILAALLRVAAGFLPGVQVILLEVAGAAWIATFALFLIEYAPMLVGPRLERGSAARGTPLRRSFSEFV